MTDGESTDRHEPPNEGARDEADLDPDLETLLALVDDPAVAEASALLRLIASQGC